MATIQQHGRPDISVSVLNSSDPASQPQKFVVSHHRWQLHEAISSAKIFDWTRYKISSADTGKRVEDAEMLSQRRSLITELGTESLIWSKIWWNLAATYKTRAVARSKRNQLLKRVKSAVTTRRSGTSPEDCAPLGPVGSKASSWGIKKKKRCPESTTVKI